MNASAGKARTLSVWKLFHGEMFHVEMFPVEQARSSQKAPQCSTWNRHVLSERKQYSFCVRYSRCAICACAIRACAICVRYLRLRYSRCAEGGKGSQAAPNKKATRSLRFEPLSHRVQYNPCQNAVQVQKCRIKRAFCVQGLRKPPCRAIS